MHYFKHSKFSSPLIELLNPYFKRDVMGEVLTFLGWLSLILKNDNDKREFNGIHVISVHSDKLIKYMGPDYLKRLETLWGLGLLIRDDEYAYKNKKGEGKSKCYYHGMTDLAKSLLASPLRQYLEFIKKDKIITGKIHRSIAKRGLKKTHFDIGTVNYTHQTILYADFNHDLVKSILDKMPAGKQAANTHILIQIVEKKWKELKKNEETGRCYNPLNMISQEIRKCLTINGIKFARSIDMRACHMTFLADYIQEQHCPKLDLSNEVAKYRSILCNEKQHPKDYFAEQLGITPQEVKLMLNTTLNGGKVKGTAAWFRWFQKEFPALYGQWDRANDKIKKTGVDISRIYESKIFRDDSIIQLAKDFGVTVIDAHDALFIYGEPDKAKAYALRLKNHAQALAGFNLQFGEDNIPAGAYDPKKDLEALKMKIKIAEKKNEWVRVEELKADLLQFIAKNQLTEELAA